MNLISKLPSSAKAIGTVMALCLPVVMMAGMAQPQMLKWFLGAYLVLGVIASFGAVVIAKRDKKKAQGFSEDIKDNAGNNQGVRDPDKLREIDDLRQQFQRGIDIYKQYGKDLYSLPWYVVVGESGSGKTEALRRSEVGLPDKLQDYWQGTGGTLSMHWWFTNRAVILDTAGRLFVRDGAAVEGPQTQWTSFLQMLRKNRPDCPINGLVLVIPATSLIKLGDESADASSIKDIDAKAGQIAKQMEVLQSELGVRFPVYILVTKTDRIIGFREFFEHVETPEERYQMLGWSNPAPLGQPFNPQAVSEHLRETADRLRRRRMSLLKDPVPAQGKKRFDEVDSLFALPASFEGLAPKLERYLRQIFAVDEWSAKPPFLRGIYFTSALQQGAVLDEALARAVGMTVQEYESSGREEDLSLARNRSYFLRDFFLEKVFAERGLVCKTTRTVGRLSGWKLWVPMGLASALLLVGLAGWLTGRKPPPEFQAWSFLVEDSYSTKDGGFYPLLEPDGNEGWRYIKSPVSAQNMLKALDDLGNKHLKSSPKLGWLFAPATWLDGEVQGKRDEAYRVAVDGIVAGPLLEAAIDGIGRRSEKWISDGVPNADRDALLEILACLEKPPVLEKGAAPPSFEPVVDHLLHAAGLPRVSKANPNSKSLANVLRAAYGSPPLPAAGIDKRNRAKLAAVIDRLFDGGETGLTRRLQDFDNKLKDLPKLPLTFSEAESRVRALNVASASLKDVDRQIGFVLSSTSKKEDPASADEELFEQPHLLGKQLLEEHGDALRQIDASRLEKWRNSEAVPEESGKEVKQRAALALAHGVMLADNMRTYEAKAKYASDVIALDALFPDRLSLETVRKADLAINKLQVRSDELGMKETGDLLLGLWAEHFIASRLPEHLGFPLVFNTGPGDNAGVLQRDEAAAAAALVVRLTAINDSSRTKLAAVKDVAESIFELENLAKGVVQVKDWEISVDPADDIWSGVVSEITVADAKGAKPLLTWDAGNALKPKLLAADSGARITFKDNDFPAGIHKILNGDQDFWAPVHWAVASIAQNGNAAVMNFQGRKVALIVKPPASFPDSTPQLPTLEKLKK